MTATADGWSVTTEQTERGHYRSTIRRAGVWHCTVDHIGTKARRKAEDLGRIAMWQEAQRAEVSS